MRSCAVWFMQTCDSIPQSKICRRFVTASASQNPSAPQALNAVFAIALTDAGSSRRTGSTVAPNFSGYCSVTKIGNPSRAAASNTIAVRADDAIKLKNRRTKRLLQIDDHQRRLVGVKQIGMPLAQWSATGIAMPFSPLRIVPRQLSQRKLLSTQNVARLASNSRINSSIPSGIAT